MPGKVTATLNTGGAMKNMVRNRPGRALPPSQLNSHREIRPHRPKQPLNKQQHSAEIHLWVQVERQEGRLLLGLPGKQEYI